MCGLTGLFRGLSGGMDAPVDAGLLRRMTGAIAHRGPDAEGFHLEPGIGLGFRRLSFLDLAGGDQPMGNETGSVMAVFNGEIYNFKVLRTELQAAGHVFKTTADTEVILHGWEEWGLGVLDRIGGMFAIALWDRNQRTLLLARDRLGKKPLYYGVGADGALAFGSELAALAQVPGLPGPVDPQAVEDFLAFGYIPDPASIYARIRKLPAAHFMLIRAGSGLPEPVRYWSIPAASGNARLSLPEAAATLREKLAAATAARLIADVPLGAFLSGGLDSSAVLAMASKQSPTPLQSFTIGFPGPADEREAAAAMARHCGAAHFTEVTTPKGILAAARDQARIFGEPFGDASSVPTLAVAALARRHVKGVLSGDGGDEVFAGYRRYRWHQIAEGARRFLPPAARRHLLAPVARAYPKLDRAPRWLRAKNTLTEISLDSALGYYRTLCKTQDAQRRRLFSATARTSLDGHDPSARIVSLFDEGGADTLRDAQRVDIETYLPGDILVKVDRTSMAVGLEVRVPLLDHDLVAWGLDLPPGLKLDRGKGKAVLREAAAPLLPPEILSRPKQGFAVSLGEELRRNAAPVREALLGAPMQDSGLFDPAALARLIDEHEAGSFDHAQPLWLLLVMEGFLATVGKESVAQPVAV